MIARCLAQHWFKSSAIVMVPNCSWTGHECDVLAVDARELKIIDCEIKISRADLKADAKKVKWWEHSVWSNHPEGGYRRPEKGNGALWPHKVWKHYYCLPADLWTPELEASLPSPHSGVLGIRKYGPAYFHFTSLRRVTANKDAPTLKPEEILDIARLANLRMWDALAQRDGTRPSSLERVKAL